MKEIESNISKRLKNTDVMISVVVQFPQNSNTFLRGKTLIPVAILYISMIFCSIRSIGNYDVRMRFVTVLMHHHNM